MIGLIWIIWKELIILLPSPYEWLWMAYSLWSGVRKDYFSKQAGYYHTTLSLLKPTPQPGVSFQFPSFFPNEILLTFKAQLKGDHVREDFLGLLPSSTLLLFFIPTEFGSKCWESIFHSIFQLVAVPC